LAVEVSNSQSRAEQEKEPVLFDKVSLALTTLSEHCVLPPVVYSLRQDPSVSDCAFGFTTYPRISFE